MTATRPRRLSDEQKVYFTKTLRDTLTLNELREDPTRIWRVWAYQIKIGGYESLFESPAKIKDTYSDSEPSIFEKSLESLAETNAFPEAKSITRNNLDKARELVSAAIDWTRCEMSYKNILRILRFLTEAYKHDLTETEGDKNVIVREHKNNLYKVLEEYSKRL